MLQSSAQQFTKTVKSTLCTAMNVYASRRTSLEYRNTVRSIASSGALATVANILATKSSTCSTDSHYNSIRSESAI